MLQPQTVSLNSSHIASEWWLTSDLKPFVFDLHVLWASGDSCELVIRCVFVSFSVPTWKSHYASVTLHDRPCWNWQSWSICGLHTTLQDVTLLQDVSPGVCLVSNILVFIHFVTTKSVTLTTRVGYGYSISLRYWLKYQVVLKCFPLESHLFFSCVCHVLCGSHVFLGVAFGVAPVISLYSH